MASEREAALSKVRAMRLEMCRHTSDDRRFPHGAPLKPKRYCDECIVDALLAWGQEERSELEFTVDILEHRVEELADGE